MKEKPLTDSGLPTKIHDKPWVSVNLSLKISGGKYVGKWLVFVPVKVLDETWVTIRNATLSGKLGFAAKSATMRPSLRAVDSNVKVICVYTRDYRDKEDVLRVRKSLRDLGFVKVLSYKTDEATLARRYGTSGSVSKYRSDGTEASLVDLEEDT